jgi:hypothetical protein
MKKLSYFILFIFLSVAVAENEVFTEYNAHPEADHVLITWITKDESKANSFIIKRSIDDKVFIEIDRVKPKGPGHQYEYIDENIIFKSSSAVFYKIYVVNNEDMTIEETGSMMVHPNISGIFRTWGAIKAMFR